MSYTTFTFRNLSPYLDTFDRLLNEVGTFRAGTSVESTDSAYTFELALPGFKREDVAIEVDHEKVLSITATPPAARKGLASVARAFQLWDDADVDGVTAKLEDGLLTVSVKKVVPAPKRKVTVA